MKHHDLIAIDSIYEVINASKPAAIFHTGYSGIGLGRRCDGGRLQTQGVTGILKGNAVRLMGLGLGLGLG